jgi:hypothetical protein
MPPLMKARLRHLQNSHHPSVTFVSTFGCLLSMVFSDASDGPLDGLRSEIPRQIGLSGAI